MVVLVGRIVVGEGILGTLVTVLTYLDLIRPSMKLRLVARVVRLPPQWCEVAVGNAMVVRITLADLHCWPRSHTNLGPSSMHRRNPKS